MKTQEKKSTEEPKLNPYALSKIPKKKPINKIIPITNNSHQPIIGCNKIPNIVNKVRAIIVNRNTDEVSSYSISSS